MISFAKAVDTFLTKLMGEALVQLHGVPEEDLNMWRPAQELQDINTFYALMTHTLGAGEYWILHAAAGQSMERNRPAEFRATGSLVSLALRADTFLTDTRLFLATLTEEDLGRMFVRGGDDPIRWTVAECLMHAVEHTGVHAGHLQIQRQLWEAERRS